MFDAYFAPPHFHADDAVHMAEFGVAACLVVLPTAHQRVDEEAPPGRVTALQAREQVVEDLQQAGVRAFIADGVSPHLEPERAWHRQWALLSEQVAQGEVHALGELVMRSGSHRALRIIDQHLELAREAQVPVLVAHAPGLESRWQEALYERAQSVPELWHWTRVTPTFASEALQAGQRVIAAVSGRDFQTSDLDALLKQLTNEQVQRLAIGSSRGRGLNPFALAASEMLLDEQSLGALRRTLLEQPALFKLLQNRASVASAGVSAPSRYVGLSPL